MPQVNILVINLKKREDKLASFKKMNPHIKFKVIEGIDGSELPNNYKEVAKEIHLDEKYCNPEWWFSKKNFKCMTTIKKYLYGRIGCVLSHYKALQYAIDNSLSPLLILEDDARLVKTKIPEPPDDCFMFYLGGSIPDDSVFNVGWNKINPKETKIWGTFGYGFSKLDNIKKCYTIIKSGFTAEVPYNQFKHKWHSFYKRMLQPIDNFYINQIHKKTTCYLYNPILVEHVYDGKSDVSNATHKKYSK